MRFPVTIPFTPPTFWPFRGEIWPAPWMSWIATAGATVLKLHVSSAGMLSGGSFVSWSVTPAAKTVTVHCSEPAKSVSGFRVNDCPPPLTEAVCAPLVPQEMEYQLPETLTGSLKPIVTLLSTATSLAPFPGFRLVTVGAASWVPLLRGFGAPTVKSAALSFVSVAPAPLRNAAVVLLGAAVAPLPSKQFAAP